MTAQTLAAHAGFLARIGRLADSLVALERIRQMGISFPPSESRRLRRTLASRDFDRLREHSTFKLVMMDLSLPAQPFARPD